MIVHEIMNQSTCILLILIYSLLLSHSTYGETIATGQCSDKCFDGNNCSEQQCKGCFFSCSDDVSCSYRKITCKHGRCRSKSDCTHDLCKGCLYCQNNDNDLLIETCPHGTFKDVTDVAFRTSDSDYWHKVRHSGKPSNQEGPIAFADINGDNIVDYFNSMHGKGKGFPYEDVMELGIGILDIHGKYSLKKASERIICTDSVPCSDQMVIDNHGSNMVDLDGDGIVDIYISNGGGRGTGVEKIGISYGNWLYWGSKETDDVTEEKSLVFKGGRDASRAAGIDMENARGRFNFVLDANGDGLLDIFCSTSRRVDNNLTPGVLFLNQGNRTWTKDTGLMEYGKAMLVTDTNGDRVAKEFLINRGFCYPHRAGPDTDSSHPALGPFSEESKSFCNTRPVGTNAIYAFNSDHNTMEEISKSYKNFWAAKMYTSKCCEHTEYDYNDKDCSAVSIASGDIDDDQIADHIFLYPHKLVFFFSSDRPRGIMIDNMKYAGLEMHLPEHCELGRTVQLVDFDNDGRDELFVMCKSTSVFLVYTKGSTKMEWILQNQCNRNAGSLGDLSNPFLMQSSADFVVEYCDSFFPGKLPQECNLFLDQNYVDNEPGVVSIVDFNNDGFRDVVYNVDFGLLRFFENKPSPESQGNKFISFVILGGAIPNKYHSIGATIILIVKDKDDTILTQFREISSIQNGSDFFSSKEDRVMFGLGKDMNPKKIEVTWSNGLAQQTKLNNWEPQQSSADSIEILDITNSMFRKKFHLAVVSQSSSTNLCLASGKTSNDKIVLKPCRGFKTMKWKILKKGTIMSSKFKDYCLVPLNSKTVLVQSPVHLSNSKSSCNNVSWLPTKEGYLRYGASNYFLTHDGSTGEIQISHRSKINDISGKSMLVLIR